MDRRVPPKELVTHRLELDQADEAYKMFEADGTGKVCFTWG